MAPQRKIVIKDYLNSSKPLKMGDYVWALDSSANNGRTFVEYKNAQFYVPSDLLADTPVPVPYEKLKKLDICFEKPKDIVREIHNDQRNYFRILECKHGNLFLEDTQTGIFWSTRLIFIGPMERNKEAYLEFWERHYRLSTDQIHFLGIGI